MDQQNSGRRKLQFRLRTLLAAALLIAVVLVGWLDWVRPRLAFEALRRDSITRLDWAGKDSSAKYRTERIKLVIEKFSYRNRSTPVLAYVGFDKKAGTLNIDWIGMDQGLQIRGIEITGNETVNMSIESGLVEHAADRLIYSTTIRKSDHPEKWPRLTAAAKLQACLAA